MRINHYHKSVFQGEEIGSRGRLEIRSDAKDVMGGLDEVGLLVRGKE